jgi:hypothetical protein
MGNVQAKVISPFMAGPQRRQMNAAEQRDGAEKEKRRPRHREKPPAG